LLGQIDFEVVVDDPFLGAAVLPAKVLIFFRDGLLVGDLSHPCCWHVVVQVCPRVLLFIKKLRRCSCTIECVSISALVDVLASIDYRLEHSESSLEQLKQLLSVPRQITLSRGKLFRGEARLLPEEAEEATR